MSLHDHLTAEALAQLRVDVRETLPVYGVPEHLRRGLLLYLSDGILPGSFLQACLCNNLEQAVFRSTANSLGGLRAIMGFLAGVAPAKAWGSPAIVLDWTVTPERLEIHQ